MHGPINVKSPNNISKWQMGFNSAFKGLKKKKNVELTRSVTKQKKRRTERQVIKPLEQD
jgi:hypothetical protein